MSRASAWTRYARLAFLIPAVLYVLFAFVVPIVYNLILSFEQTSPATISSLFAPFAGLSNYKATLVQPVTQSAITRTFIFTAARCSSSSSSASAWPCCSTCGSRSAGWPAP